MNDTIECLESFKKVTYPNYELVIIDNASRGNDADVLNEKYKGSIRLIRNSENLGFAGGNNVGIKDALDRGTEYILLLNNDTIVDKDFITEMVKVAETSKQIGMVGSKIYLYSDPKRIWSAGGKINSILTKGEMVGYNEPDNGQYGEVKEQDFMSGCCLLVKKEVIVKIGGLPEEYFLYYEDTDWCLKARRSGFKCVYAPLAKIWHKASVGLGEGSPTYIYYHIRNGLLMAKRNGSALVIATIYAESFLRIIKQIFKYLFIPSKRTWAKYILVGIKDFYLGKTGRVKVV